MPTAVVVVDPMPSFDTIKMEDRKRPALDDHEASGPPSKRQTVSVNGTNAHPDDNMPWKDDLERYQKDAILREMRAYKREAQQLESEIASLTKTCTYHDDHLRMVDVWFAQFLDEIALQCGGDSVDIPDRLTFSSSLFTSDSKVFEEHLQLKSEQIKSAIARVYSKLPDAPPQVAELQTRLSKLLATEKDAAVELQRLSAEKDQLSERLDNASYRYMVAEKKRDRLRSTQVAKVEAQAIGSSKQEASKGEDQAKLKSQTSDALAGISSEELTATETARKEAVATSQKRAEQLEILTNENKKLLEELTTTQIKLRGLSDQDYANSDLFKSLKSQHEDVVKRFNDIEALNVKLQSEEKKLKGERESYKKATDDELRDAMIEMESQAARTDADLARIRHARDELLAEISIKKATEGQQRDSYEQMKKFSEARDLRVSVLESEVERLRQDELVEDFTEEQLGELDDAALRSKIQGLAKQKSLLDTELRSMEAAWKKASASAVKKISDGIDSEERLSRLSQEKAKADQKYFGAMKAKEQREAEVKALKAQSAQASQVVTQLKEKETSCRSLISQQEKQIADLRESLNNLTVQQRSSQAEIAKQKSQIDRSESHLAEIRKILNERDIAATEAKNAQRKAEVDLEQLKVRLEETEKEAQSWKKKSQEGQSEEAEHMQMLLICNVCRRNFKNTLLKNCGHVFCQECIDTRWQNRSRKCPNCNRAFGGNDWQRITL